MANWTVMTPEGDAALEDAVFVRDGFNWWAAVFGPFWALFNRMWIIAILLGAAGLAAGLMPPAAATVINVALLLVAGIFASDLRIWSLRRQGFTEQQNLNAANLEEAEVRFFIDRHVDEALPAPPVSLQAAQMSGSDPLGLFGRGW